MSYSRFVDFSPFLEIPFPCTNNFSFKSVVFTFGSIACCRISVKFGVFCDVHGYDQIVFITCISGKVCGARVYACLF